MSFTPSPTVAEMGDDSGTFLSIPENYLPIILIVLFFATVIFCCISLILALGMCIVCCRAHNRYHAPNITSPMMQSDDKLWKPISKPLTENDNTKYLEESTEITLDTFKKDQVIATPSHNATSPLIQKNSSRGASNDEITLSLNARPYQTPSPSNHERVPSTFTSQKKPASIKTSYNTEQRPSLTKSTSEDSMYMKMESSNVQLHGKPYVPDTESLDSVSYVDYILPTGTVKEDEYQNVSAFQLAKSQPSASPSVPKQVQATVENGKNRPPEPKPKPRKMKSAGLINPVLLQDAAEPHYMSPRSAGIVPDGYKALEFKTTETNDDYTLPTDITRNSSLPGHASAHSRPIPPY